MPLRHIRCRSVPTAARSTRVPIAMIADIPSERAGASGLWWWTRRLRSVYAILTMCVGVALIYVPDAPRGAGSKGEWALSGSDYYNLHARRLRYAREALFGPGHHLPGWYTREMAGTPFWSNIQ